MLLSVLHVSREELSIEALLELLLGYFADVAPQHPLSSLPPGGASILKEENCTLHLLVVWVLHVPKDSLYGRQPHLGLVGLSMDPSKVLGLYFLKSLRCLASADS